MEVKDLIANELIQINQKIDLVIKYVFNLPEQIEENNIQLIANRYWISWTEQLGAWVNADGSEIEILIREDARDMDIGELTLGFTSVLTGTCLNLQGQVAIHANAVSLENLGIAFVGYSGMGKSTLSAYCASRGAGFITDDVLVVDKSNFVLPGNTRIKLYPETGESLGLEASEETDYKIFYAPQQLGAKLHNQSVPLGIVYLIEESADGQIYSSHLPQTQAVFDLLTHGYDVSHFIPNHPNLLNAYTCLVAQVPVKKLFYPRDFSVLPQVYDFLLKEIHQL